VTFQDDVAAEVRAELARKKISGIRAAKALGWSQYYVSVRLRGEVAFSLADLEKMAEYLEIPVMKFFGSARAGESRIAYINHHGEFSQVAA
jgi:transcriptional regulator with XRE-family HTH domain